MPIRTEPAMGTLVTIHVVEDCDPNRLDRAFGWFYEIERRCTRFDSRSELMQLCSFHGQPIAVSPLLFEAIRFAKLMAEESGGVFDPTVGHRMAARGFNREYATGRIVEFANAPQDPASFRDIEVDLERRTVQLLRPLLLDLSAVAKGLAIDMAARELESLKNFAIDAGGDLYFGGHNPRGEPWCAGIRHPRKDEVIATVRLSDAAVCTSGDYERRGTDQGGHILDPRTNQPAGEAASATVIAPNAMLADALATAAFVLGPAEGIGFLGRLGVEGLILTPALEWHRTQGFPCAA